MTKFLLSQILVLVFASAASAASCDIEPMSDGKFGVREFRASGWVYLVRNLTYRQAERALEQLQASGRCD